MTDPAPATPERLALVPDEIPTEASAWEAATAAVLRKSGRLTAEDPDDLVWHKLARTTLDGIDVAPLGTPDTAPSTLPARPSRVGAWDVRVAVDGNSPTARADLLAELETGAASLWITCDDDIYLDALLDGVLLDLAPVVFATDTPMSVLRQFASFAGVDPDRTVHPATNLGVDALIVDPEKLQPVLDIAQRLSVRALVVDATALHERGASDAQEVGYSLAVGVAALRNLAALGLSVDEAARLIEFRYAATVEQFPTIAKLRAARQCWRRVLELCGADGGADQVQHAVTSRVMMSKYDPYVNMLRGTVAAFAAGVGGAEAVTVVPFDSPLGTPNALGRRIARNTSALLIEESHLAVVADPAGGAYAVERLTADLAEAAWVEFGRIEEAGGVIAALEDESIEDRIVEVVLQRNAEIARRKRPITGLTEFPNLGEQLPEREGQPDGVRRYGVAFENLRDQPIATPVFLATLGPVAQHTARATFATNLFAAGGIAVTVAGPTTTAAEVVAAYDGGPVVCLAGTDKVYAEWGGEVVNALREAGAKHVILAGKPDAVGLTVDDSCAMGVNALDFLTTTREKLA